MKINNDEVVVAGYKKVYLLDIKEINNYKILDEINCDYGNSSILKLSNNLFLTGEGNGRITQYKIENKKLLKESYKNQSHEFGSIFAMTILNDMIISGGINNEIKIWKK